MKYVDDRKPAPIETDEVAVALRQLTAAVNNIQNPSPEIVTAINRFSSAVISKLDTLKSVPVVDNRKWRHTVTWTGGKIETIISEKV